MRCTSVSRARSTYQDLTREEFVGVARMLADGFTTHRGRRSAHLHFDRVNDVLRGRRGASLTAVTNGGAIPDQFDYDVVLLPSELPVGTLNEDFAFESMAGDIFQLGNASYRIEKLEGGKVYVTDAHGQPPTIPFWLGEAPGRSDELSMSVGRLNDDVAALLDGDGPGGRRALAHRRARLERERGASSSSSISRPRRPRSACCLRRKRVIFERFFDETGDAHLVVHSPFGSRVNRAWGLSLRKRFCRRFNFELQAAALEDSIVISLGAVHSFALEDVVHYLSSKSVRDVLTQAVLAAPVFGVYWRWNASTALAVRRFRNGKKQPAQFQRMDAEDLLSTVFPDQLACAENLPGGDREIPDHPLVKQTLDDCLTVNMDVDGLVRLLERIEAGEVEVVCRELTSPSPLAQEILGAKPYAFLDDAPAEERRTLAVQSRRYMTPEQAAELGSLDADAIARVRAEAWPQVLSADELHDALVLLGFVTADEGAPWHGAFRAPARRRPRDDGRDPRRRHGVGRGRAARGARRSRCPASSRPIELKALGGDVTDRDTALRELVRSRFEALGPITAEALAQPFGLPAAEILPALAALEQQGTAMRGQFTARAGGAGVGEEWCERRLLARIHRYTLKRLRNEIEPDDARGLSALPVPLAGLRRRAPRRLRGAARGARRAPGARGAGRAVGARGVAGAALGLQPAAARSALHGRRDRLVAAAAERRRARRAGEHGGDVADRARAARRAAAVAHARLVRAGRAACRARPSASSRRCASAVRCSSSSSCRRAACCACRSRRRSASSSRAAS